MIKKGKHEHWNEELEFVEIDLRTTKHKNRMIEFIEKRNQLTNELEYDIRAEWTAQKYHPNMSMSEDELLEFAEVINGWVTKIKKERSQRE
ncbi:hypothetical protein QQL38_14290 [Pseudomonas syringae]|uniref:hypothetical protein n=1 Tax=Pseudomonas syringae TaxID=317 RepID=UPI000E32B9A6|nr:hypothetical protein [Pseudomonas syringae]MCL6305592.1 hypothetical protein [Pseudomonas syringae]